MNAYARYLPFGAAALAVVFVLFAMQPPTDPAGGFHLHDFATLPVEEGGRKKPLDSLARNELMQISGHQMVHDEKAGDQPAVRWLLDVLSDEYAHGGPSQADKDKVFRIDNDQILKMLNLPLRPGSYRYALEEFAPQFMRFDFDMPKGWRPIPSSENGEFRPLATYGIGDEAGAAVATVSVIPGEGGGVLANVNRWRGQLGQGKIAEGDLNSDHGLTYVKVGEAEAPLVDLTGAGKSGPVRMLAVMVAHGGGTWFFKLIGSPDAVAKQKDTLTAFIQSHQPVFEKNYAVYLHAQEAGARDEKDRDTFDDKVIELGQHLKTYEALRAWDIRAIPPATAGGAWTTLRQAEKDYFDSLDVNETTARPHPMMTLIAQYTKGDAAGFNQTLDAYRAQLNGKMSAVMDKAAFETAFNDMAPFYQCAILYVLVFVLTCLSWVGFTKTLNWSAFAVAVVALIVHTGALISRMYLMDRPLVFVTNLYSTAVFIGWVCVIAGLVFEAIYRNGIGNFVGSVAGFCTMVIAQFLSIGGDTLEMMRAVLDTNFWLATHVTAVNAGYAATFVAGLLGTLFVLRGVLTKSLDKRMVKTLGDAIYGAVCFATLFSFTGTVLGGIWADQSWGRFWGWDPKENGALIIVVWNALILHARWGGMVKQRGMAVLTLVGNIVTAWSWFGVNLLGIGLHAYGFQSGTAWGLAGYAVSQLVLIAVGLLPLTLWRSYAAQTAPELPPPDAANGHPQLKRHGKRHHGITPKPA